MNLESAFTSINLSFNVYIKVKPLMFISKQNDGSSILLKTFRKIFRDFTSI